MTEIDVIEPFLDPAFAYDFAATGLAFLLHETLFQQDAHTGHIVSGLAASYTADGSVWTIGIEPGRRFADGEEITAQHFDASVRALARKGSPLKWLGSIFDGFGAFVAGETDCIAGFLAEGRYGLRITTVQPIGYLPELLSSLAFAPRQERRGFSSGPYKLAGTYPDGRGVILESSPFSRRTKDASPQWLAFVRTDSPHQGLRLFQSGQLHITCGTTLPPEVADREDLAPYLNQTDVTLSSQLLPSAAGAPLLANRALRCAISSALDRPALAARLSPTARPIWRYTDMWTGEDYVPARDSDIALKQFQTAGAVPSLLEISYADFPPNGDVVGRICSQIETALPIRVVPRALDYDAYITALATRQFELMYCITPAAFPDPSAMLLPFAVDGVMASYTGYRSSDFQETLLAAGAILDQQLRWERLEAANDVLLRELPIIPILQLRMCQLVAPEVGKVPTLRSGYRCYDQIRVTKYHA